MPRVLLLSAKPLGQESDSRVVDRAAFAVTVALAQITTDGVPTLIRLMGDGRYDAVVMHARESCPAHGQLFTAIREKGTVPAPLLVLVDHASALDRARGLDAGADNYLTWPVSTEEITARLHALMRRRVTPAREAAFTYADLLYDPVTEQGERDGHPLALTPTESALFGVFMRNPRQVLTRRQLIDPVWGYQSSGAGNMLEVYVGYLRRKLETGGRPRVLHTVRGVGYKLSATA